MYVGGRRSATTGSHPTRPSTPPPPPPTATPTKSSFTAMRASTSSGYGAAASPRPQVSTLCLSLTSTMLERRAVGRTVRITGGSGGSFGERENWGGDGKTGRDGTPMPLPHLHHAGTTGGGADGTSHRWIGGPVRVTGGSGGSFGDGEGRGREITGWDETALLCLSLTSTAPTH